MKQKTKWVTTREPNLLKNDASGRFYGRFHVAGKPKWFNLKTDEFKVAKVRLAEERVKIERGRLAENRVEAGTGTMGQLAEIFLANLAADADVVERTKQGYRIVLAAIRKTWPDFDRTTPEAVTREATITWRDKVSANGTGHRPPGAKATTDLADGSSPAHINKAIDVLRRLLDIAVSKGQLGLNPLRLKGEKKLKLKAKSKKVNLPPPTAINSIFAEIEKRGKLGGRGNGETANFCRFLAFTGCRLNEATSATWQDVNFEAGTLTIHGTKTESAARTIPMVPDARALLEKLNTTREGTNPAAPIFSIKSAKKALKAACDALKLPRLTHHDLRDAFATTCIESGVDIPTVAAWLGHKDGGALLMRVYQHHRMPHSKAQAAKVNFGGS